MPLYFHGTKRRLYTKIIKQGLVTRNGRATFTKNPAMAVNYLSTKLKNATKKMNNYLKIKEGMILVIQGNNQEIRVANESYLVHKKNEKLIEGWPNRFKTEQHGFFLKQKTKKVIVPPRKIPAAFKVTNTLVSEWKKTIKLIESGNINNEKIKLQIERMTNLIADKKIWMHPPSIPVKLIAKEMVLGIVRNVVLKEIRQSYLSVMKQNGWKIENRGDHKVKLKTNAEVLASIQNIKKIIGEKFVPKIARTEYAELVKLLSGKTPLF